MADEEAEDVAEEEEAAEEEGEDGGQDDGESGKKKPKEEGKPKKSKKLFVILGILLVVGVSTIAGIYFYTEWQKKQLAKEWGTQEYTPEEKAAIEKEKKVVAVVKKRGIKREYFDECNQMSDQYTTPKGWNYSKLPLRTLLGLSKYAVEKDVEGRCIEFAKIVEEMEKVSRQDRHVFLCEGAKFELSGGYFFRASEKKDGVYQNHEAFAKKKKKGKLFRIPIGKSLMYNQWQFFNVGDGCYVVGYSKAKGQVFTMGAELVADEPQK